MADFAELEHDPVLRDKILNARAGPDARHAGGAPARETTDAERDEYAYTGGYDQVRRTCLP